jgi:all-trans-retinol dehydrogenase (NAD+)
MLESLLENISAAICIALWFIPRPKRSFVGKNVLITGGGSGIGRLMAIEFGTKEKARICLWDINPTGLETVARELKDMGVKDVATYQIDVTDKKTVYQTAERVKKEFGKIDVLVNNAGIVAGEYFWDLTDQQIEKVMNVNAIAPMIVAKAFLPDMIQSNSGHLVTISSAASTVGSPKLSDYCASKWAVFGWAESVRLELRKKGYNIQTTIVCPFYISTGMFSGVKNAGILMKILTPEYVVAETMEAIRTGQEELYLTRLVKIAFIARILFPAWVRDTILDVMGVNKCMDEFDGLRKVTK